MASAQTPGLPEPKSKYCKDYLEAFAFYRQKNYSQTVAAAKYNLTDPTLSAYWKIKNCILVSGCTTDFKEGEDYRHAAEDVWKRANERTAKDNEYEQFVLSQLRGDLDELIEQLERSDDDEGDEEEEEYDDDEEYEDENVDVHVDEDKSMAGEEDKAVSSEGAQIEGEDEVTRSEGAVSEVAIRAKPMDSDLSKKHTEE